MKALLGALVILGTGCGAHVTASCKSFCGVSYVDMQATTCKEVQEAEFRVLGAYWARVPEMKGRNLCSDIRGVVVVVQPDSAYGWMVGDTRVVGLYEWWSRKIILMEGPFLLSAYAHEIGHAIDLVPHTDAHYNWESRGYYKAIEAWDSGGL